jgi:hypothetical protein
LASGIKTAALNIPHSFKTISALLVGPSDIEYALLGLYSNSGWGSFKNSVSASRYKTQSYLYSKAFSI